MSFLSHRRALPAALICAVALVATTVAALLPTRSLANATATISGTVTNGSGNALNGATITVYDTNNPSGEVATATTASGGAYSVTGLAPNVQYNVYASAPGYVTDEIGQYVEPDGSDDSSRTASGQLLALALSGTVTDGLSGHPLAGMQVELFNSSNNLIDSEFSDVNGVYQFSTNDVSSGGQYSIEVDGTVDTSNGYESGYSESCYDSASCFSRTLVTYRGTAQTGLDISTVPTSLGEISGVVSDANGTVAGAWVEAMDPSGNSNPVYGVTAADGSYVLPLDPAENNTWIVEAGPGPNPVDEPMYYQSSTVSTPGPVEATPVTVASDRDTHSIDINLGSGATITGTITDGSGNGIGGVTVDIENATGQLLATAVTTYADEGTAGSYTVTGLPAGTYYPYVDASALDNFDGSDYVSQFYGDPHPSVGDGTPGVPGAATPVSVGASQTATVDQALGTGAITGAVTDASGNPVTDESVSLCDTRGDYLTETSTDGSGSYAFPGVPPGSYTVHESPESGSAISLWYATAGPVAAEAAATTVTVSDGSSPVADFPLPATGAITGTVTQAGQPVSAIPVAVYDASDNLVGFDLTATDAAGGYEITGLPPGSYEIGFANQSSGPGDLSKRTLMHHATLSGLGGGYGGTNGAAAGFQFYNGASTLTAATPVTVSANGVTPAIDGALSTGGRITGTVTDATTHSPVGGTTVYLLDAAGDELATATSGSDGTYTLAGVPTGSYYLEFKPTSTTYQTQYYENKQVLNGSTTVAVTAGQTTSAINAALVAASTAASGSGGPGGSSGSGGGFGSGTTKTTTQTVTTAAPTVTTPAQTVTTPGQTVTVPGPTVTTPAPPTPGAPSVTKTTFTGASDGHPALSFAVSHGANAKPLTSLRITLPSGFGFSLKALAQDLTLSAPGTYTIEHGVLVVTLKTPTKAVTVTFKPGALTESHAAMSQARKHAKERFTVDMVDSSGHVTVRKETIPA